MKPVYIRSAELSEPLSHKPALPFRQSLLLAAQKAIQSAHLKPSEIHAFYVAAMGSFPHERFLGSLPPWLATQLKLHRSILAPMLVGSSESGAWGLNFAFRTLRSDHALKHVLIIAGEQMNPLKGQSLSPEDRKARNQAIAQVVADEDRKYGLNMLRISDLLMDAMAHHAGLSQSDLRAWILPFLALEKYRRVKDHYPFAQFFNPPISSREEYWNRLELTPYFKLDDVSPTTSGAVAIVLSSEPHPALKDGQVQILGMGQGFLPQSLSQRVMHSHLPSSVTQALQNACTDAQRDLSWLKSCDFAIVHDAFPSIEWSFLQALDEPIHMALERMLSGWSNPLGGLKACGHAVGASGLLQVAKAFQLLIGDRHYIPSMPKDAPLSQRFWPSSQLKRCFTTSVGGALTNVLVTLIEKNPSKTLKPCPSLLPHHHIPVIHSQNAYHACIIAKTLLSPKAAFGDEHIPLFKSQQPLWIYWLLRSHRQTLIAFSHTAFNTGDHVKIQPLILEDQSYWTIDHKIGHCLESGPGLDLHFWIHLEKNFVQRHVHNPWPWDWLDEPLVLNEISLYLQAHDLLAPMRWRGRSIHPPHQSLALMPSPLELDDPLFKARQALKHPALLTLLNGFKDLQGHRWLVFDWIETVLLRHWKFKINPTFWHELREALDLLHGLGLAHGRIDADHIGFQAQGHALLLEGLWLPLTPQTQAKDLSNLQKLSQVYL